MKKPIIFLLIVCSFLPLSRGNFSYPFGSKVSPTNSQSDQSSLTILSLNTWGLPIRFSKHKQAERFKKIPEALNTANTDIICLQECFSKSLRKDILYNISASYSYSSDYTCNRRSAGILNLDCHGGLMTFSKYPILAEYFYPYPNFESTTYIEKIGAKGFLVSLLDLGDKQIYVINTHLFAGHEDSAVLIRERQMEFMWLTLIKLEISDKDLLLVGDLNISHPKVMNENNKVSKCNIYRRLISEYGFIDGNTNAAYTIDPLSNHYCNTKEGQQILDYILYKPAQEQDVSFSSWVILNGDKSVSDHSGLHSQLFLEPSIPTAFDYITTSAGEASIE